MLVCINRDYLLSVGTFTAQGIMNVLRQPNT